MFGCSSLYTVRIIYVQEYNGVLLTTHYCQNVSGNQSAFRYYHGETVVWLLSWCSGIYTLMVLVTLTKSHSLFGFVLSILLGLCHWRIDITHLCPYFWKKRINPLFPGGVQQGENLLSSYHRTHQQNILSPAWAPTQEFLWRSPRNHDSSP